MSNEEDRAELLRQFQFEAGNRYEAWGAAGIPGRPMDSSPRSVWAWLRNPVTFRHAPQVIKKLGEADTLESVISEERFRVLFPEKAAALAQARLAGDFETFIELRSQHPR